MHSKHNQDFYLYVKELSEDNTKFLNKKLQNYSKMDYSLNIPQNRTK